MQLLTLLRRTCSLSDDELDRTKAFLISLADEANPIISRSRFFSIMSVVRAKYGGDVDFLERMARVFNTKGDQQLTVEELTSEIQPHGRATVPDEVKADLLQRIRRFVEEQGA